MLVDLRNLNLTGKEAQHILDEVNITCNKNGIPYDPQSPFITSGIRIGTPAVTSRGFKEDDMKIVGELIAKTIKDYEGTKDEVMDEVAKLCKKHPLY